MKLKLLLKIFLKLGITLLVLLLTGLVAVVIYLSSPTLINKTLPVWLQVDETGQGHQPRFAQALSFEQLQARYQFQGGSLAQIKANAEENGVRIKHQGHVIMRMMHDQEREDRGDIPSFNQRLFGYQILALKQFPEPSIDLIVSEHPWFNYYLVIEFISD